TPASSPPSTGAPRRSTFTRPSPTRTVRKLTGPSPWRSGSRCPRTRSPAGGAAQSGVDEHERAQRGGVMTQFIQLTVYGMANGAILALAALGFVLIYKATSVLNFAQGELLLVGAYLFYTAFVLLR